MIDSLRRIKRQVKASSHSLQKVFFPDCRSWRPPWLSSLYGVQSESKSHPHCPAEKAEWFLSTNAGSTELEILNWLYATAIMTKPQAILETGAYDGVGTLALAAACKANGFGLVHSLEIDPEACKRTEKELKRHGLENFAKVHCISSLDYLQTTDQHFEMGFFDSLCDLRPKEYHICVQRNLLTGVAAFHDTSPTRTETMKNEPTPEVHGEYRRRLAEFSREPGVTGFFELSLSRGLFVIFRGKPTF